ncbi:MAG: hypothetical protein R3F39_14920 [Myxococcota bacterium]
MSAPLALRGGLAALAGFVTLLALGGAADAACFDPSTTGSYTVAASQEWCPAVPGAPVTYRRRSRRARRRHDPRRSADPRHRRRDHRDEATVSADRKSYSAGGGPGVRATNTSWSGGGGSHGGRGGNGYSAGVGTYYDSGLLPLQSTAPGGGSRARSAGGAGGGVVRIAAGGTLTVDGTISAEGSPEGTSRAVATAEAARAAIRLKADVFAGGGLLRAGAGAAGTARRDLQQQRRRGRVRRSYRGGAGSDR